MKKLIAVKLGGSIITNKNKAYTANRPAIKKLAVEIKSAIESTGDRIIIGHGSGSFGHTAAAKYKTQKGLDIAGLSEIADAAVMINRIVIKEFLQAGLNVISFSPVSFTYATVKPKGQLLLSPIRKTLQLGFIPVVYGDVIMDEKKGYTIFSGETTINNLLRQLSADYRIARVIQCGDTDGVYDSQGKIINTINQINFNDIRTQITGSAATDVTGGMAHKVEESLQISSELGIEVSIISGLIRGRLRNAMTGKNYIGTTIKHTR